MKKDKRIKVIHKQNGGASSARNKGLEKCSGDYVYFCDSDDFIEKIPYPETQEYVKKVLKAYWNYSNIY